MELSYFAHLQARGCTAQTLENRRYWLERAERYFNGGLDSASLGDLEGFIAHPSWSRETKRAGRSALRSYFRWLQATGRRKDNPAEMLPPIKPNPPMPRPTARAVIDDAYMRADDDEKLMIRLAVELGLRRGEIARVHARDIFADGEGFALLVHGKGGRERLLPLPAGLAGALRKRTGETGGFAFPGKVEGHLSAAWVGKRLSRLLPDGVTPHGFRHAFGTRIYEATGDILVTQKLLGHASPTTTQLYVGVPMARLRAAIEKRVA